MANEMEHLKINGMEFTVNDPDATHDITKIVSGDTDEWVNLRDLASGTYILSGKFHAYAGHTSTLSFSSALMVNVIRSSSKSSVQIFYPTNNCVQFLEITDEAMTRTNVYLNKVLEYIGTLSDLTTADKTSLVAAINELVEKSNGGNCDLNATDDGYGNITVGDAEEAATAAFEIIHGALTVLDGVITYEGATNTAATRACMNPLLLPVDASTEAKTVRITIPDGFMAGPSSYVVDDSGEDFSVTEGTGTTFSGTRVLDPGWQSGTYDFAIAESNMFGIAIKRTDNGTVTDDDIAALNSGLVIEVLGVGEESEMTSIRFGNGKRYAVRDTTKLSKSGHTPNMFLGTDENGNVVEKEEPAGAEITDEQISNAVSAWLDEHPEATTTVADGSITTEKLADAAVTEIKTNYLEFSHVGQNLFDKTKIIANKQRYQASPWDLLDSDTMCVSDFIPVEANTTYLRSAKSFEATGTTVVYQYTFFTDADKNFISSTRQYYGTKSFTTPENCAYIQINLPMDCIDVAMVVKGDTEPAEYVPYTEYFRFKSNIQISKDNIFDLDDIWDAIPIGRITKEKLEASIVKDLDAVDHKVNTAAYFGEYGQKYETLTGRINVYDGATRGIMRIDSDISAETIVVHGLNFFDQTDLVSGFINLTTGAIEENAKKFYTNNLIPVQPGVKLYLNRNYTEGVNNTYLILYRYAEDGSYLGYSALGANRTLSHATDENTYFVRLGFEAESVDIIVAEDFCMSDVYTGDRYYGIGSEGHGCYNGVVAHYPYVGYRIENGKLIGASEMYTLERRMYVKAYNSEIEVQIPKESFDLTKLQNVSMKFGRHADTDYFIARIYKKTITGDTITPRVLAATPGGIKLAEYAKTHDFVFAINAGIFNTDDNSCLGTTISDGVVVTDHVPPNLSGAGDTLGVDGNGDFVSIAYDTTTADMLSSGITQAVHGWGTIISNYAKSDLDALKETLYPSDGTWGADYIVTAKHPRTACGQFANGDYMVFVCGGRTTNQYGMTIAEMQELFAAEGVKYAYNLDGGGSCNGMLYKKEHAQYTESRADPSYIVFD